MDAKNDDAKKAEAAKARADELLREKAALAALSGYISRYGAMQPQERPTHMRLLWELVDDFVLARDLPPAAPAPAAEEPRHRKAHPADEFAVVDGERKKRGFITYEEAKVYAQGRPGARVVQVAGPGVEGVLTAPAVA